MRSFFCRTSLYFSSKKHYNIMILVQRILSYWQFDLPIFLIVLLPKPRRSHRYDYACEAVLSEKYSASNYPKLNFRCTRGMKCGAIRVSQGKGEL